MHHPARTLVADETIFAPEMEEENDAGSEKRGLGRSCSIPDI
jgi:hypothetical protein